LLGSHPGSGAVAPRQLAVHLLGLRGHSIQEGRQLRWAGWASLLVGGVVAIVGAILVKRGTANMDPSELAPTRTADQLGKDAHLAKEQTQ
jgi:hypothetical protein